MPDAEAADAAQALLALLLGYAALLATPGPNMLAIGGIAATRGFVRALPLCFGIVAGVASVAGGAALLAEVGGAAARGGDAPWRIVGAALLAWVAVAQARAGDDGGCREIGGRGVAFCAGFCVAATNPLTIAFIAAQVAAGAFGGGAAGAGSGLAVAALLGVVAMALGFYFGMAVLMANPVGRRAALRWGRPIRLASAAALLLSAATMLRPVVLG